MVLLADGWHMGTHSASYAKKHADNKSFNVGTGKVNYLSGFASAVAKVTYSSERLDNLVISKNSRAITN
jgi:Co/Zn/Cd efflux system component